MDTFTIEELIRTKPTFPSATTVENRMDMMRGLTVERRKIDLIKEMRSWYHIGLKEGKEIADHLFLNKDRTAYENELRTIASGQMVPNISVSSLRNGINACIVNWHKLGYDCVQDAIIEFLERTK